VSSFDQKGDEVPSALDQYEVHGPAAGSAVAEAWANDYLRFESLPVWQRELRTELRGSEVDVAIPAGRALGVVRETARLLAAEQLRAPDEAGVLVSPSASSRSAGPIHGSGWIEAKIS
jgi:hypothetical protein